MGKPRGPALTTLPAVIHPEQRLTIPQVMALKGCSRSHVNEEIRAGRLRIERHGPQFVRIRAGDVLDDMTAARVPSAAAEPAPQPTVAQGAPLSAPRSRRRAQGVPA